MWKTVSMRLRNEDTRDKILDLIGYDIMNKRGTGYKDIMKIVTDIGSNFSGYKKYNFPSLNPSFLKFKILICNNQ